jgi:heterodisulfide reductase subunit A-like polyferredoxin/coenzyme F420-reducing hydrogenase delta subunit
MDKNHHKIGAVLVQGGGIAGVQASLDLANAGFKVYLIEHSAAIGGMMAHLDKTFPSGDCATCIVSPKLVECARNLNIEILTLSELVGLEGKPGKFKATVRTHPRYVDEHKCTACGDCTQVCPVNINDPFNRDLGTRKAIAKHYAQAIPHVFSILKYGHAPCKTTCPAHINVQGYIQLIKKREYLKAVNLIRERNPLSAICGRVCPHPCEAVCARGGVDAPVAIRLLKRFASDQEMAMIASGDISLPEEKTPLPHARPVAVIGAGPAGLTVANDLAERGCAVTVYEALAAPGGMLRWGIPEYRLPEKVLQHEIDLIRRKGVVFVLNCRVGRDISIEQIRQEHEAIFIGVGVHKSRLLGIEGEGMPGVLQGLEFLRGSRSDAKPQITGKVAVIGGGNVAVDVARTALRLGATSVEMICLEQRHEMPAYIEEIAATLAEGIRVRNGWGPRRILGEGSATGIELQRCTRVFDAEGHFKPVFAEHDRLSVAADQIIVAIGQRGDDQLLAHLGAQFELEGIKADPVTLETSLEGMFAGGDSVSGPASVIEAVAAGKRAADSIERYLKGKDLRLRTFDASIEPIPEELLPATAGVQEKPRVVSEARAVGKRVGNFDEVEIGWSEDVAVAEAERCLNCALCSECKECSAVCEHHAIDHCMPEKTVELDIGAVILTPGVEEFAAQRKGEFGFGRYPNVLTSVQFERMLSAAGPFEGHVIRRSDGREAKRIAWIQCVGSRDSQCGNEYCSSICCMATTKQAMVAMEHVSELETTIFYMDIRAYGKDFDQYYERANRNDNLHYIKSIPSRIMQMPGTNHLRLRYVDESAAIQEQQFDLVVLSVGLEPTLSAKACAARLGIELNAFGFCATDRLRPLETSRPGVFVAGAFQEPKDIPESVTQASGAACKAMELLAEARHTLIRKNDYPDEHDITDEAPRIGVFVCHCGINIASVVDVERVTEDVARQPDVVIATHTMFTCSDTSLSNIKDVIHANRLNRIVVASCTPRTHEPLFRETLREAGLNPYLFELANIRDQCSWVHASEPEAATEKAIELVNMAVARARLLSPLEGSSIEVDQNALIIGGGLSGMTAALSLADQGFRVYLVERSGGLGGHLGQIYRTFEHDDMSGFTTDLIDRVAQHVNIKLYLQTDITAIAGHIGKFCTTLSANGEQIAVSSGVIIVATGARPAETTAFLNGTSPQVMTQAELEKHLHDHTFPANGPNVVMIQCVGSRNDTHPYCSRICCSTAVKNALCITQQDPDARVFVLYRDIRTYGFRETYYTQARQAGVLFIRYNQDKPPVVSDEHGLTVSITSPDIRQPIDIEADHVVLSTGIEANLDNTTLANMLKVPLNSDGFYVEAHTKLRPVECATEGVFLCGLAHSPKGIDENIAQAQAAASRAATVLSQTHLEVSAQVSYVDQHKCMSCMTCVGACPYNAPFCNQDGKAQIEAAKCMGCGLCVSKCPAHATQLHHFQTDHFQSMIDALFTSGNGRGSEVFEPKILAFCCHYCAYASADLAGSMRMQYPSNIRIIRTPCTGRLEVNYFMKAFEDGADGVLVAGCLEGGCHFTEGNLWAKRQVHAARDLLAEIGVEQERLRMVNMSAAMARPLTDTLLDMVETVRQLGPSPMLGIMTSKESETLS